MSEDRVLERDPSNMCENNNVNMLLFKTRNGVTVITLCTIMCTLHMHKTHADPN